MQSACVMGIDLAIFGDALSGAPVVFVTHGRGGQKEHMFDCCTELADDGLIAIALDQRNHGPRTVDAEANAGWSLTHAADMYGAFVGTAHDVSGLIDLIPARLGIATDRVGMTGISLGGHATLAAMALDTRIAVGAPIIGGGDYRHLMWLRGEVNGTPPDEFPRYFTPAMETAVRRYDPIHHAARFADRPLLLLNGADDNLVQLACNERFYAAARPFYTDPERLQLHAYPGVGHAVPPEMWAEARAWLRRWLR
jgi:dienelactone hydrolase